MEIHKGVFMFSVFFLVSGNDGVLELFLDNRQDSCRRLTCTYNVSNARSTFTALEMTVYNASLEDEKLKMASVSIFTPNIFVNQDISHAILGTGNISRYHAYLTLEILGETDCFDGNFQCQLDFIDVRGQADVIRKSRKWDNKLEQVMDEFTKLKEHSKKVEDKLTLAGEELNALKLKVSTSEKELSTLEELKSKIETYYPDALARIQMVPCIKRMSHNSSRQKIKLWDTHEALCDTETDGGGWIIIQRRTKGDVDFFKNWDDYKNGFGTQDTDFWIGNDIIHNLTSMGYNELRVDMVCTGKNYYSVYANFSIGDERTNYKLSVSGYRGTAGDSLTQHSGYKFSTYDKDNDIAYFSNCATQFHTAWWCYKSYYSNLNGQLGKAGETGAKWFSISNRKSLQSSEMKIRYV